MTPKDLINAAIIPALSLLPEHMDSPAAKAMLIAIALQESGLRHRVQVGGPAKSFWQFEPIGVRGVQEHHATTDYATGLNEILIYHGHDVYDAIEHNDVLAAGYARLLLWKHPDALPGPQDAQKGWDQYLARWKPGKPHYDRWHDNFFAGWEVVA